MNYEDADPVHEPFAHWPPHGPEVACHEGYCRRCELEQLREDNDA